MPASTRRPVTPRLQLIMIQGIPSHGLFRVQRTTKALRLLNTVYPGPEGPASVTCLTIMNVWRDWLSTQTRSVMMQGNGLESQQNATEHYNVISNPLFTFIDSMASDADSP